MVLYFVDMLSCGDKESTKRSTIINPVTRLSDEFFKQFKTKFDFQDFFFLIFKHGIETMLRVELDEHLGYEDLVLRAIILVIPRSAK